MKVLALQLKRIGDVILTTPALTALAERGDRVSLIVDSGCRSLLPAISGVDEKLVHKKRSSNLPLWRRLRAGGWDVVLDFTGSDRSALMSWVSRGPRRIAFDAVRRRWWKRVIYQEYVDSPVRLSHTCDHYLALAGAVGVERPANPQPSLHLPPEAHASAAKLLEGGGIRGGYVVIHPGTARPEKYWLVERWVEIVAGICEKGEHVAMTCGPDAHEQHHVRAIMLEASKRTHGMAGKIGLINPPDLLALAAVIEKAHLVLSCDTAVVHLAAAFQKPQITLFGPTNPFHWRPRHEQAIVLSAACPEAPLTAFQPKMKGAPMEHLPLPLVKESLSRLWSR